MLKNYFFDKIISHLDVQPTNDQKHAIEIFCNFITNHESQIMIINGYAGTGKTTLIKAITLTLQEFNYPFVLLAPTGRAAKVLSSYCSHQAYTIHKYIYRQKSVDQFIFELNYNQHKKAVFFVDEASLISNDYTEGSSFGSGYLLEDLLNFVFQHKDNKLVIIGDTAQLPPVGSSYHYALKNDIYIKNHLNTSYTELKEVIRQQNDSIININATLIRKNIENEIIEIPPLVKNDEFTNINSNEALEYISQSYDKVGINETIILCYSNKRALQINKAIRNRIFAYDNELNQGDLLMVVKNNYFELPDSIPFNFIANGELINIKRILKNESIYGFNFKKVIFEIVDYPDIEIENYLLTETLNLETPNLPKIRQEELFNNIMMDYNDIRSKKKKLTLIRENKFFNALQVKYGYAITTHKAQGGQWKHVYIDLSFLNYTNLGIEQLKWLYTAITRATEKIYLIDIPHSYQYIFEN